MDKFGCVSAIKARFIALGLHKFSENRIFTDADDYSMEIELPLADCPQNLDIFGMITRKDVDTGDISLMRCLPWDISIGTQKREPPRAK